MNYEPLYRMLRQVKAEKWGEQLPELLTDAFDQSRHGTLTQWKQMIEDIADQSPGKRLLNHSVVTIGSQTELLDITIQQFEANLKQLMPWRKGPYDLFGIRIDTEWRSDWKWERLRHHIAPLGNRLVLDVGCGNGYHCWRMLGEGAKMVVGIDPLLLNVMQFHLIRKLYGEAPVYVLPFGLEELPPGLQAFDSVFSMGVLYHRRSPIDHLLELKACLKPGGELILETLVIKGGRGDVLVPEGRYAKMRNVWFIPSCDTLVSWLKRCGFVKIRIVDITKTSTEEQRGTEWMQFSSLKDFLDPDNADLTCEGLPAPRRAIAIAEVAS